MRPITILYEDAAVEGRAQSYGPHRLVLRFLADQLNVDYALLAESIGHVPRKGAAKLRNECRRVPPQIGNDGRLVVAVYDADKIHRDVGLSAGSCKSQLKGILSQECHWRERLIIVFLEKNIETVLAAIRASSPQLVPTETWDLALVRKDRNSRDLILNKAARPPERLLRQQLLQRVPSLAYLIRKLTDALSTPADASPPPG